MKALKTLYKKQYIIFHNKYLSTTGKKIRSTLMLLALLAFLVGMGYIFTGDILNSDMFQSPDDLKTEFAFILFFIILMFSIFQMITSAQQLIYNFYESPDIQYLLSMPIPMITILIFKLFNHTFKVVRSESIFAVPMILFIAVNLGASPFFYVFFPIIYFLAASTATCLGIVFGILYLKRFSIKSYKFLMGFAQIASFALFWIIFVNQIIDMDKIFNLFAHPLFKDYLIYLLPAYTGSLILSQLAYGLSWSFLAYLTLFLGVIAAVLVLASFATRKAFHRGLMNVTIVPQKNKSKQKIRPFKANAKKRSTLMALTLTKLKTIRLKTEFIPATLIMFIPYFLMIAAFCTEKLAFSLITDYAIMIGLGFFFITSGVNILMLSEQATTDLMFGKNQYRILKVLPISSADYFFSNVLATVMPSLMIMSLSLLVTFVFKGISLSMGLLILLIQGVLYMGGSIQNHAIAIKINEKTSKGINWGYNLLSTLYSALYYFLTFGIIVLYDNHLMFNWSWLKALSLYAIAGGLFVYLLIQYILFPQIALKAWENTEF